MTALKKELFLICFVFCCGCVITPIERFKTSFDQYQGSSYKTTLTEWTKHARIYKGFDTVLIAQITFKSSQFRNAYAREYVRTYNLSAAETDKLVKDQKEAEKAYNDFFVAIYTPEKKWNDFHKKDSIWKIYLADGNKKIEPFEVRKIKKIDAVTTHFFPYVSPWKSVYIVRFPKTNTSKTFEQNSCVKLVITSVLGSNETTWKNSLKN